MAKAAWWRCWRCLRRTVRTWQYAAYAGSLPDAAAFEALVEDAGRCWGWRA